MFILKLFQFALAKLWINVQYSRSALNMNSTTSYHYQALNTVAATVLFMYGFRGSCQLAYLPFHCWYLLLPRISLHLGLRFFSFVFLANVFVVYDCEMFLHAVVWPNFRNREDKCLLGIVQCTHIHTLWAYNRCVLTINYYKMPSITFKCREMRFKQRMRA